MPVLHNVFLIHKAFRSLRYTTAALWSALTLLQPRYGARLLHRSRAWSARVISRSLPPGMGLWMDLACSISPTHHRLEASYVACVLICSTRGPVVVFGHLDHRVAPWFPYLAGYPTWVPTYLPVAWATWQVDQPRCMGTSPCAWAHGHAGFGVHGCIFPLLQFLPL